MKISEKQLADWREHPLHQLLKTAINERLSHEEASLKSRAINPVVLSSPEQVQTLQSQALALTMTRSVMEDFFESSAEDLVAALEISDEE